MKIGILSDSHGKLHRLEPALDALQQRGVELLVHCGDVGSPECVQALGGRDVDAHLVVGNVDRDPRALEWQADLADVQFGWEVDDITLPDGRKLAATHGDDETLLGELTAHREFTWVCHGHTHRRQDERVNGVHVINPGALHHPRGGEPRSCAVLDTGSDTVEFVDL